MAEGLTVEKRFRRTELRGGDVVFNGQVLRTHWVRWNRNFEDGYYKYQQGQVVEINDKRKLRLYLEEGYVTPSEPAQDTKPQNRDRTTCLYQFLTSVVDGQRSYGEGTCHELERWRGDKWAERGICKFLKVVTDGQQPETRRK